MYWAFIIVIRKINLHTLIMQTATVRHILPKANEIVDTAQANFKSAYPF